MWLARSGEREHGTAGSPTFLAAAPSGLIGRLSRPVLDPLRNRSCRGHNRYRPDGLGRSAGVTRPRSCLHDHRPAASSSAAQTRGWWWYEENWAHLGADVLDDARCAARPAGSCSTPSAVLIWPFRTWPARFKGGSVCDLIVVGKPRHWFPLTLSGVVDANIEDRAATACQWRKKGFRHLKLFYKAAERELLETMGALRSALPAEVKVAVDALWRLKPYTAFGLGRELDRPGATDRRGDLLRDRASPISTFWISPIAFWPSRSRAGTTAIRRRVNRESTCINADGSHFHPRPSVFVSAREFIKRTCITQYFRFLT